MSRALAIVAIGLGLTACAAPTPRPAPGRAGVVGTVVLVPHADAPSRPQPGAYGDRRLRDVRFVDYSKPGYTIVYLDAALPTGGRVELAIEAGFSGPRLRPEVSAVGVGGEISIANHAAHEVVVSLPGVGRIERIGAGDRVVIPAERAGALEMFLLGSDARATVWTSPGPWTQPDAAGRFALSDLPPGRHTLRAWHPRLPSGAVDVELRADATAEVAFEIGVGRDRGAHDEESHGSH